MKKTPITPSISPSIELKVGDAVYYVLPEKLGGRPVRAEIISIHANGLHLKVPEPAHEVSGVVHHPAELQAARKRTNTWHTIADGDAVAAKVKADAEAKAKAEAEARSAGEPK